MIANPALTMERECRRPILSEGATFDPFETLAGETPPLQHDPLERKSFPLANAPIVCHTRDAQLPPRRCCSSTKRTPFCRSSVLGSFSTPPMYARSVPVRLHERAPTLIRRHRPARRPR
jgi:hypothetical protein